MSRLALAVLFPGLFVCVLSAQAAVRPNCKYGGYTLYKDAGGSLMYHEIPVTFDDAKKRCAVEGGVLASPINSGIKAAMMHILLKTNGKKNVFTGFYAEPHNGGVFSSVEGTQLSDVEHTWARDEPNNVDGRENCIMLSPHGIMSDVQCDNRNPYFCFVKEGRVCGEGYAALDDTTGSCYKLHSNQLGFDEAVKVCEQEGGQLLIINGDNEAQAAASLIKKNNVLLAHLGFQLNENPRKWMTIQGETIEDAGYAKWYPFVAASQKSAQGTYSGVLTIYGLLTYSSPLESRPFICEKDTEIVVCE